MQIKLLKVGNGTSTLKPPFKSPFYRCHFQILPYWGVSSEFCHMIINTLLRFVLKSYLKCFTYAIDDLFSLYLFHLVLRCQQSKDFARLLGILLSWRYCECQRYLRNDQNANTLVCLAVGLQAVCNWHQWKFSFPWHW